MSTFGRLALRKTGSNRSGGAFDRQIVNSVWNKAVIVVGVNPAQRRKDICGAWIDYARYGDTTEQGTGWEIDHIIPISRGGADDLPNLQPLQWQNNRLKADRFPIRPDDYRAVQAAV